MLQRVHSHCNKKNKTYLIVYISQIQVNVILLQYSQFSTQRHRYCQQGNHEGIEIHTYIHHALPTFLGAFFFPAFFPFACPPPPASGPPTLVLKYAATIPSTLPLSCFGLRI